MNLHVILGPPGAGKAGRAVATLRETAQREGDAFLCVPGAVDRARFLREVAGAGRGVMLGVEVGTFDQLIARIAGSPPVRRTDRAMERIVVRDALTDVPAFHAAAEWSGFVDTARAHVDQLRRARVWGGSELERVEAQLPGVPVEQWHALEQRVGQLLDERRLRDDAWFEQRAARALRAGRSGVGGVVVYGFEQLPPARIELLERLAQSAPVTVTLVWRPGRRVHERAADLRDRWRAKGAFIEELAPAPPADPILGWLGDELFEDAPATMPQPVAPELTAPAPVAFVDCCGPLQEAEEVVREVALLGGNGFEWDDIVVASARADDDGDILLAAFERAGIPARLQSRRRAIDVPAGRALHGLLQAVLDRDALQLVAAVRAPIFGMAMDRIDAAELQLRGGRHRGAELLHDARLQRVLRDEVAALIPLAADRARADGSAHVDAIRALIASLQPSDLGELDLLRGIAALVEGLVVAAGSGDGIHIADVRDAIAAFPLTVPDRSDSGTVVIASLDDLRSVAYDAVVLRGMHLAGFRARVDDETEAPAAARDLLYLAVTRARRTLRVVRQRAGADGGHQAPSPAWEELRRLLGDSVPTRQRRLGEVVIAADDVRLDAEVAPALVRAAADSIRVDGAEAQQRDLLDTYRPSQRTRSVGGVIGRELAAIRTVSATAIERYATCSAKWFLERWLKVSDPDDDGARMVDGQLAHELLRVLAPEQLKASFDRDRVQARALGLVPELITAADPRGVLDQARIERIVQDVVTVLEHEQEWERPDRIDVERSFGADAEDAIGNGLLVDGVEVTGRVDRIDHYGSHVVLHDYKYSATPRPAKSLIADHNLQLLVYWLALQQPGTAYEPVGGIYRSLTKAGAPSGVYSDRIREIGMITPRTRTLDDEARAELLSQARDVIHDAVTGIRAGTVAALNDSGSCPTHCRLQPLCRVGEASA